MLWWLLNLGYFGFPVSLASLFQKKARSYHPEHGVFGTSALIPAGSNLQILILSSKLWITFQIMRPMKFTIQTFVRISCKRCALLVLTVCYTYFHNASKNRKI
jgi:hypothetical protein